MTYEEMTAYYRERAQHYRELAEAMARPKDADLYRELAKNYERAAASIRSVAHERWQGSSSERFGAS